MRDKSKERRHREKRKEKEARGSEQAGQGQGDTEGREESVGQKEGEVRARVSWYKPCGMSFQFGDDLFNSST